jgi:hypothetical protein
MRPGEPARPGRLAHVRLTRRRALRAAAFTLAGGVAAAAMIVSYSHIYDLGRAHRASLLQARLTPVSVDMLVVAGELMLLHEADAKGRRFWYGWLMVWSGIAATLAANIAYGLQGGPVGALYSGWPGYSFVVAAIGVTVLVRRVSERAAGPVPEHVPAWPALVPEVVPAVAADRPPPHTAPAPPGTVPEHVPEAVPAAVPEVAADPAPETAPGTPVPAEPGTVPEVVPAPAGLAGHAGRAADLYAVDLAAGRVPGVRRLRRDLHLGGARAERLRAHLAERYRPPVPAVPEHVPALAAVNGYAVADPEEEIT